MRIIVVLETVFALLSVGQEIHESKTCDISRCSELDILNRLTKLEEKVAQQNTEIQIMKETEEKLQKDLKVMNKTLNLLQSQVRNPYSTSSSIPPTPTVVHDVPSMTTPSYTIPTTGRMGQDFYLIIPFTYGLFHQIMMSSESLGWALISIPNLQIYDNITVNFGTTYRNLSFVGGTGSETKLENNGIHVVTSIPITLYIMRVEFGLNPFISPIYDKNQLGTTYIAGTYQATKLGIVSTSNNTTVSITFHMNENVVYDSHLYRNGDTLVINMDYLSTFSLITSSPIAGTKIISNSPICVMDIGHSDYKQLHPVSEWGKLFIVLKPSPRMYTSFVTPSMNYTNVIITPYISPYHVIHSSKELNLQDLTVVTSNSSIMLSMSVNGWDKSVIIPPVSRYTYNYSCPLPYFNRPYTPAYENIVLILVQSHNIEGIKVNDHVVTINDVQKKVFTTSISFDSDSTYNISHIAVNVNTSHHVHVVSKFVEVGVIILGYSFDVTKSHEYFYDCI